MSVLHFLIFCLATFRISSLIVQEDGPFFIFRKLREKVGIVHHDDGDILKIPETFFGALLSCVWCCSVWVALGWWGFWLWNPDVAVIAAMWPAISAGAIVINRATI